MELLKVATLAVTMAVCLVERKVALWGELTAGWKVEQKVEQKVGLKVASMAARTVPLSAATMVEKMAGQ